MLGQFQPETVETIVLIDPKYSCTCTSAGVIPHFAALALVTAHQREENVLAGVVSLMQTVECSNLLINSTRMLTNYCPWQLIDPGYFRQPLQSLSRHCDRINSANKQEDHTSTKAYRRIQTCIFKAADLLKRFKIWNSTTTSILNLYIV